MQVRSWLFRRTCSLAAAAACLIARPSAAQSPGQALPETYRALRNRLVSQFMIGVGSGFGESIPASIRNTHDRNYAGSGTLKWGDATIDLAYYIVVLATEHALLDREGLPADETRKELFYALDAFNRLDYHAEGYFGGTDTLDGFFVRSDVGRGLLAGDRPAAGWSGTLRRLNASGDEPVSGLESEWITYSLFGDTRRFAASKDQVIHLLAAMAVVAKCVPPEASFGDSPFLDGETRFVHEAQRITDRIMGWMHRPAASSFPTNWTLRSPGGKRVGAGYNAWTFSCGLSGIQKRVSGTRNPVRRGFSHALAKAVYRFTWFAFKPIYVFNRNEGLLTLTLVAAGHDAPGLRRVYRRAHALGRTTWYHVPLLHALLHDLEMPADQLAEIRSMLAECPAGGPVNLKEGGYAAYTWSSTSLLIHPQRRGVVPAHFPGRYNGLDYMVLFNLYLLNAGYTYSRVP